MELTSRHPSRYKFIGHDCIKEDAQEKVAGIALYVADIKRPSMLVGKVLRSPFAHALIKKINVEAAKAIPGVVAVLIASDIPGKNAVGVTGVKDQPVLVEEKVRFYGEAVAFVAAETIDVANQALKRIQVEYETLSVISSPEEAMAPDAAHLHTDGCQCLYQKVVRGDYNRAILMADLVVTNTYHTQFVEHACIEPDAAMAEWERDRLTVWVTSKDTFSDRCEIARVTGLPLNKVRVIAATVGGSFGGKSDLGIICAVSLLAQKTGRPVKLIYSREECFQVTTKRHPFTIHYTHGATREGKLVAVKMLAIADAGAYTSLSSTVITRAVIHGTGPYDISNVYLEGQAVYTNNPVAGAMRGYGVPQVTFAFESQMDCLAKELGMDPFELRIKNALRPGMLLSTGQVLGKSTGMVLVLERILDMVAKEKPDITDKPYIKKAWGGATCFFGNGMTAYPNPGLATIRVGKGGVVVLFVGSPDVGQGSNTVFTQIAAETLGIAINQIKLVTADTQVTKDSGPTVGTRLTYVVGKSVEIAAINLKKLIEEIAAKLLGQPGQGKMANGMVRVGRESLSLSKLFRLAEEDCYILEAIGRFDPPTDELNKENGQGKPYGCFTFGAQYVKVAVNIFTGKVSVEKVIAVYDVGTVINPKLFSAQVEGGVAGGLGYGLMEEVLLAEGQVTNPNFDSYLIPTSMDVCPLKIAVVETYEQTGPYGAKGIGEPALIPTAAALINAICKATGVRIFDLPATPEKLLASIRVQKGKRGEN